MGCDIHTVAERKVDGKYESISGYEPFDWRSYFMYGFLADVRNYSDVPPLAKPRGMPDDASVGAREMSDGWGMDGHSHSWLSVAELLAFRYDERVEDRRVTVQTGPTSWDGGATAAPGGGEHTTWREALGPKYFEDLARLSDEGAVRVVFWFDN
jgi:hypothetical protein